MKPKKSTKKPSQKFMGLLIDYNESGGSDNGMLEYVAGVEAVAEAARIAVDVNEVTAGLCAALARLETP